MKNNESELDGLTKPVTAFITFETQEGYERACEMKGDYKCNGEVTSNYEFDGHPLYFEEAPEPTNIIWEHRETTYKTQMIRTSVVCVIIVILLILAFLAFYELKKITVANYKKYPPTANCADIDTLFQLEGANQVTDGIAIAKNDNYKRIANNDKEIIEKY